MTSSLTLALPVCQFREYIGFGEGKNSERGLDGKGGGLAVLVVEFLQVLQHGPRVNGHDLKSILV